VLLDALQPRHLIAQRLRQLAKTRIASNSVRYCVVAGTDRNDFS
jgi:hypothetical protein